MKTKEDIFNEQASRFMRNVATDGFRFEFDAFKRTYPTLLQAIYNAMESYANQQPQNKTKEGGIQVGSLVKRIKLPTGNGHQVGKYTIGKVYEVEKIKENYRFYKVAVALRSDDRVLRWLSLDRVREEHILTEEYAQSHANKDGWVSVEAPVCVASQLIESEKPCHSIINGMECYHCATTCAGLNNCQLKKDGHI